MSSNGLEQLGEPNRERRWKKGPRTVLHQGRKKMSTTSDLAQVGAGWLSVVAGVVLFLGAKAHANDPFEFDLPSPSSGTQESNNAYDGISEKRGAKTAVESELESARLHLMSQPLSQIRASIKPTPGIVPEKHGLSDRLEQRHSLDRSPVPSEMFSGDQGRPWALNSFEWEAPATKHLPLLFEEPNLERLGYAYGFCDIGICDEEPRRGQRLQTLVSGVNFFGRIPFIPYMAGVHPLTEPVYTLGTDRAGSPVAYRRYLPHRSLKGAIYQAGAVVGAVYIIP